MRRPPVLILLAALLVALAALPAGAEATWPGTPSKIAYHESGYGPLFTIRPDGSHSRRLLKTSDGDPAWSRTGKRIAYPLSNELWWARADGKGRHRIARVAEQVSDPAWSPSGRSLVFTSSITRQSDSTSIPYIYVVRSDGKGLRRLGTGHDATWSAGGLIAFATNRGAIATIRSDGSGRRIWVPQGSPVSTTNLDFSSNGQKLVYQQSDDRTGKSTIRTFSFRNGERTRFPDLTKQVFARDVAWVPNRARIAYVHSIHTPEGDLTSGTQVRTIGPNGHRRKTLFRFPTKSIVFNLAWQAR